jgi:thiamine biosynthesis lipoprotein
MNTARFRAMGCDVVVAGGTHAEHREIERLFQHREQVFSRFIADSELNHVNASAGRVVAVSRLFADTLQVALDAVRESEGLVVPTEGASLEAAGYSVDFDMIRAREHAPRIDPGRDRPGGLIVWGRLVCVPPGIKLDLNGVVKALAIDDALATLSGDGFVSAGGDLATRGHLTVALPGGDAVLLRQGALATSGTTKRRWLRAGQVQHHLIDPRTGAPAMSPWAEVTACGSTCVGADVAAKGGFLLGEHGPEWLDDRGIPARFVSSAGTATLNLSWRCSMEQALTCT